MVATLSPPARPTQMQPAPVVKPLPGETQCDFYLRANKILVRSIPKQNNRSVEIIRLWQASGNDADIIQDAKDRFHPDRYTYSGPRCIFLSHTIPEIAEEVDQTTGELICPGRPGTVYNQKNIQHLVDYANYRIRNAGQFAALSEGHMPTADEKEKGRPDANVMGYAGPFYIAQYGNVKPQWAIFCDEWIHNDDVSKAHKLQRRSPEVWCKEPIERRTMDPIAMLGSETPRLDSGMNLYAKRADGTEVTRYSMGSCLPGADNCYVPGAASGKPTKYGANEMIPPQGAADPSMQDPSAQGGADISDMVVEAVAKLMPSIMQAVQQQMQAGSGDDPDAVPSEDESQDDANPDTDIPRGIDDPSDGEPNADGSTDSPTGGVPNTPPAPQSDAGAPPASAGPAPTPSDSNPAPGGPPAQSPVGQPIDDQHQRYMAMGGDCGNAYAAGHSAGSMKGRPMTTNYSKSADVEAKFTEQEARIAAQAKRIQDLETAARDAERYAKIHEIALIHEIGNEAEHCQEVLDVSEDEFDRYCKALRLAPKKGDVTGVEIFDDPRLDLETENYSRRSGTVNGKQVSKDDIDRYSRQAADLTVRKNAKGGEKTTYEAELKTIYVANGLPDPTV